MCLGFSHVATLQPLFESNAAVMSTNPVLYVSDAASAMFIFNVDYFHRRMLSP